MRDHCAQKHGWINQQKRGGNTHSKRIHSDNKIWTCNHACQQFFKEGAWKRYFEVSSRHQVNSDRRQSSRRRAFFQSQLESITTAEHDVVSDAARVQGFDDHRSTVIPWLRETGIVDHLRGLQKKEIKAVIALPSLGENDGLYRIVDATESMLREAHSWCFDGTDCMLTWPCRVVLSRFQSSQTESFGKIRPFDPYKEPNTLRTYFTLAKKVLVYFDRVAAGESYFFSAESEEESFRPEDIVDPTEEQLDAWNAACVLAKREIPDGDEQTHSELRSRLLEFWMLLICQDTGSRRYRSPLLSFCAMLSIKPSTQGWLEPGNFNSHLSAIIWVVQLLFFYDAARKERNSQGRTLDTVKAYCEKYLQQTVETPMGEILRWRLLLFRVSKDSVGEHEAFWDESEQVLTYEDTELHMDQIPTLLESEYRDCRRLLYDDPMFGIKNFCSMRAYALKDNASNDVVGWNFIKHRDNGHMVQGTNRLLLTTIEKSEHLCHLFLTDTRSVVGTYGWRENATASYEATVQEFLKRLCVLMHISGGQPLRESEFFSMTWRNTQRRRSITICYERVMIHVKYHKGQQQTGGYKENVRFLPHPVGELLLDYLAYVMPLRQVFLRQQSPEAVISSFVWEKDGKVWGEGRLSRCLEDASIRACTPRLHVANWRQMTVAIVKTKFASHINAFEANDDDEDAEEIDEDIRAMTKQRNHKTRTVNRAYANQTGASFGNVFDGLIRTALRASTLWQDFWGVEVILRKPMKRSAAEEGSGLAKRAAIGIYKPRKPWSAEALLAGARKLYQDQDLQWKSPEQEQALTAIMSWTEQVVAVLPTGAGKSLLFMLPCTLPDAGTTVLVVPLVSLYGDMLRRVKELGVDHLEWHPGESQEATLVLVSAEAASSKDFMKYSKRLIREQRLDRIVVDECHLTVIAAEYRPSIVELPAIRSLKTQFVYLTATLPPSMRAEFEERNYLYHPTVVRASSNRPNIFYMVRKVDARAGSLLGQAAVAAQKAWAESGFFDHSRDKIILYVRTCRDADDLADLLGCSSYTAERGTPVEKTQILDHWIKTRGTPYIVATTALAEGFDYPHVRLVLNVDEPESLVIFAQESGRAGRDGKRAYSMVLLPATWRSQDTDSPSAGVPEVDNYRDDLGLRKRRDKQAVHQYLKADQCFRTSLSDYLDTANHRRWCMTGDVPCEVCDSAHQEEIGQVGKVEETRAHSGLDLVQQEKLRALTELSQYRLDLASVKGTCLLCRSSALNWDHSFSACSRRFAVFEAKKQANQRQEQRGRRWLQPYTCCYWCLNPHPVCERAETGEQALRECEHRDIVLPLCFGVFESIGGPRWIQEQFGRKFDNTEAYFDWLGEESRFGGNTAIQAVRVTGLALRIL